MLPAVIDEYGVELVRLMLASYAISDAPVREVMRELLDTDERFALPDELPDDVEPSPTDLPSFGLVARVPAKKAAADPERAELRERRKAAKAERRAAAAARARGPGHRPGQPPRSPPRRQAPARARNPTLDRCV